MVWSARPRFRHTASAHQPHSSRPFVPLRCSRRANHLAGKNDRFPAGRIVCAAPCDDGDPWYKPAARRDGVAGEPSNSGSTQLPDRWRQAAQFAKGTAFIVVAIAAPFGAAHAIQSAEPQPLRHSKAVVAPVRAATRASHGAVASISMGIAGRFSDAVHYTEKVASYKIQKVKFCTEQEILACKFARGDKLARVTYSAALQPWRAPFCLHRRCCAGV